MTAPYQSQPASGVPADPLEAFDQEARATYASVADLLIPAAHGMPSAADVVTVDRLRFVLGARPDLVEPFRAALRRELGDDPQARLDALTRDEPANLAALQLVLVGGYYTDGRVRELIGYPGQLALEVESWENAACIKEGLIKAVLARGPVWRDPVTGERAVAAGAPQTHEGRTRSSPGSEGGNHGDDGT